MTPPLAPSHPAPGPTDNVFIPDSANCTPHPRRLEGRREDGETISAKAHPKRWPTGIRSKSRRSRGVSDVVGTILLLALTVTLFASIFFFVNTFPRPPSQPSNQFQAALVYSSTSSSSGTPITLVQITHLAGPTLSGNGVLFYLYSARHPNNFTAPYHISDGLSGSTNWALGQTWTLNITSKKLTAPDNITVSIVTSTQLLFRITLPGSSPNLPPQFLNTGTSPANPGVGQGFQVFAQIVDRSLRNYSVFANVSQLPGASGALLQPQKMTYSAASGLWTFTIGSGVTTTIGTFYVFVNASDTSNLRNSVAIPVVIGTASGSATGSIQVSANPGAPVVNSAGTLVALVANPGVSAATANLTFRAGATLVGTTTGTVGAGSSASFSVAWTPTSAGLVTVTAVANLSGGSSFTGTLNLTVFPTITLIAHNVAQGVSTVANESAFLAEELTSAGVPFTPQFVACNAALPSGATMATYSVVIIDFGSSNAAPCNAGPSTTEQGKITTAAATSNVWVVGADAFMATACNSYTSGFFAQFGLGYSAGATCVAHGTVASAAAWTASAANGVRSDGVGSLSINQTLGGSSAFEPYSDFSRSLSGGTTVLSAGGAPVGVWRTSGGIHFVAWGTDPALVADVLPNGNSWVSGSAGTSVVYSMIGYLCGFASSSGPGRALADFGVGGVTVWGTNHAAPTTVYAGLRANGPSGGVVTATLYVNGSVALFGGVPVSVTVTLSGNGGTAYVKLVWQAPGGASYTLSVVLTTNQADLFSPNNQLPASILGQPTKIA